MALPDALTPVYPSTAGLQQHVLRTLVKRALKSCDLRDTLPEPLLAELQLPGFGEAVQYLHNPPPSADQIALQERAHPAWTRIKFDELLAQQLSMRISHEARRKRGAPRLLAKGTLTRKLLDSLPFKLTRAQNRALAELRTDLANPHPMQRLLQGDVGSGKTIVAAAAATPG